MQYTLLCLKYRNFGLGVLFFPYFTNYDDIKDNECTDSFTRCFEILEPGFVIYCCSKRQGCDPWSLKKHMHHNDLNLSLSIMLEKCKFCLAAVFVKEKKCLKTSLLTVILCCSPVLFYPGVLSPALMDGMSSEAGWASPCLWAWSWLGEAHQDLAKERSIPHSAWCAGVEAGFVQCNKNNENKPDLYKNPSYI